MHYQIAVLETTFFVHWNCCQLFQRTFPIFFSQSNLKPTLRPPSWWLSTGPMWTILSAVLLYLLVPLNEILCCLVNCEFPKANFLLVLSLCQLPFFTNIPTLWPVFQSFKNQLQASAGRHIVLIQMTCNQAQNACDWGLHILVRREQQEPEPKPKLGALRPE